MTPRYNMVWLTEDIYKAFKSMHQEHKPKLIQESKNKECNNSKGSKTMHSQWCKFSLKLEGLRNFKRENPELKDVDIPSSKKAFLDETL